MMRSQPQLSYSEPAIAAFMQNLPAKRPEYGIFEVHFSNEKKRGRGKPVQYCDAYGSLYPDGHVHLHSQAARITDFLSFKEMRDHLESFGKVRVVWLTAPIPVSRFPED